jgi:hypothetical protein
LIHRRQHHAGSLRHLDDALSIVGIIALTGSKKIIQQLLVLEQLLLGWEPALALEEVLTVSPSLKLVLRVLIQIDFN